MPGKDPVVMDQCRADPAISRHEVEGMRFPLGVYPIEAMTPVAGYVEDFEAADGADTEGDWEEWPDRYVFDIVIGADRLPALCRSLFALLPPRVYPILDVLGHDAFREIDPYISYELVGLDRFLDAVVRYGAFLYEDGMCGFGAMCDDPFFYVFVDEHKIVTLRCAVSAKDRVEQILGAFDLKSVVEPAGADAAAHEHRTVLLVGRDHPGLLGQDEVVERLRDEWRLTLNIDTEANEDDEGHPLGMTHWRCLVRRASDAPPYYAEVLLSAPSYADAEQLSMDAAEELEGASAEDDWELVIADRVTPATMAQLAGRGTENPTEAGIIRREWVE